MVSENTKNPYTENKPFYGAIMTYTLPSWDDEYFDFESIIDFIIETTDIGRLCMRDFLGQMICVSDMKMSESERFATIEAWKKVAAILEDTEKCYNCKKSDIDSINEIDGLPFCDECSSAPTFFYDETEKFLKVWYKEKDW